MSSKFLILLGLLAVLAVAYAKEEDSSTTHEPKHTKSNDDVTKGGKRHPRLLNLKKSLSLSKDKYEAIVKIYTVKGDLADKNKEADKVSEDYSAGEKKIVQKIKNFFAKKSEVYKKLSKEAAEAVKTIRELKKKEKAAFESIPKSERKEAGFVINAVAPRDLVERPHLKSKKA